MGPQSFRARLHSRQVGRDNAVLSFHEAPIDRGKRPLACGICLIGVRCCWAGDGDANRKETADQQSNSQTDGANQIDSGAHPLFYRSGGADARRDLSMQDVVNVSGVYLPGPIPRRHNTTLLGSVEATTLAA
ncbi:hypothetical protein POX_e07304 [Penicillium oxalicum]|uniref:hypothetical protein n=1 Tax=Penicillium oxalicum TaxID=69781 RepID=UPI0020B72EAD|nr:hypothetical protein POX_e07304 [Penicillium oxalicum]KAI2789274.1 hypothetical protein POX_e07304 [Penicillium oxalicum]